MRIPTRVLRFVLPVVAVTAVAVLAVVGLAAQETAGGAGGAGLGRPYWHVFLAYVIAWALVLGWVVSIARRLARIEKRLDER